MKFSLTVMPNISDYRIAKEAEDLGYDAMWFGDCQMLFSDCFATMALAAEATSRIRLGPGVAAASTRIAPVIAHSIASVHQIAPGRVFLGIGTGSSAVLSIGQKPMKLRPFEANLRVVRGLLHGEEVEYTAEGVTSKIRFSNDDKGFRRCPVPIYLGADGPKTLQLAGRLGDGVVSVSGAGTDTIARRLGLIEQGARAAGRTLDPDFHTTAVLSTLVLRPGEKLTNERVIDVTGEAVAAIMNWAYGQYLKNRDESVVPEFMRGVWEEYRDYIEAMEGPLEQRYREFLEPAHHRRFIKPELIETCCLVGTPDEIAEKLRKAEATGLKEISAMGWIDTQWELMRDFAQVIERY